MLQNLWRAAGYNILAIPLAAGAAPCGFHDRAEDSGVCRSDFNLGKPRHDRPACLSIARKRDHERAFLRANFSNVALRKALARLTDQAARCARVRIVPREKERFQSISFGDDGIWHSTRDQCFLLQTFFDPPFNHCLILRFALGFSQHP